MSKRGKSDVWMPVYIGDYLADTMRLSTAQHGAYFLLMMEYWRQGPLPNDQDELSAIARSDRKSWDKGIWPTLKRFFSLEEDGLLHQKRADRERAFAAEKSEKRSAAARAKWDANDKQRPCKTDANAYANASDLDVQNACKDDATCASRADASPSPSHISSLRSDIPPCIPPEENDRQVALLESRAAPTRPDPRGTRLPSDWQPDPDQRQYALDHGLDAGRVAEGFREYWLARAGAGARKADWNLTWRGWVRRDAEKQRGNRTGGVGKPQSALAQQAERMRQQFARGGSR